MSIIMLLLVDEEVVDQNGGQVEAYSKYECPWGALHLLHGAAPHEAEAGSAEREDRS